MFFKKLTRFNYEADCLNVIYKAFDGIFANLVVRRVIRRLGNVDIFPKPKALSPIAR